MLDLSKFEGISQQLDASIFTMGAASMPAVPLNVGLEKEMLPNKAKVGEKIGEILEW